MGLVFKQIYSGSPSSILDKCMPSGSEAPPTASNGAGWYAGVDSSTASTGRTLTLDGGTVDGRNQATLQCLMQWQGLPSGYGSPMETTTWEAGDWICRFSVSSANSEIYWDKVQICAYQPGGGVWTTIATKTGIGQFLGVTGTKSTTITTTEASTVALGSHVWWGFHLGKPETLSAETIGIRSNKNLATPIENKRAVTVVSFASSPVLPGTTFGAINVSTPTTTFVSGAPVPAGGMFNVSAPTTTFASAAAVPATTFSTLSAPVPVASITSAALAPTRLILIPYTPRGQVSTSALGMDSVVTGISERSSTAQSGIEVASISSAMIERGTLASGGPEAFSG